MGKETPFTNIMYNNMCRAAYNKICMISIISKLCNKRYSSCSSFFEESIVLAQNVNLSCLIYISFVYWHYNPLWVLAFWVILFHSSLSLHCSLHRLIPIICISSSISTIHHFFGLLLILVPIDFHSNILLGVLLSSIRITWPSQAILLLFIDLTMSAFYYWFFQLVIHSDSPGSIIILDWPKDFSQYSTLRYSEMLLVSICHCPSFTSVGHLYSYGLCVVGRIKRQSRGIVDPWMTEVVLTVSLKNCIFTLRYPYATNSTWINPMCCSLNLRLSLEFWNFSDNSIQS